MPETPSEQVQAMTEDAIRMFKYYKQHPFRLALAPLSAALGIYKGLAHSAAEQKHE